MGKYDGIIKYDKLIRDKIPEIMESRNTRYKIHTADETEYWEKLRQKLTEEYKEFSKEQNIDELSDLLEVIYAIADLKFGGVENLEKARKEKHEKHGGFEKRLILDETNNT